MSRETGRRFDRRGHSTEIWYLNVMNKKHVHSHNIIIITINILHFHNSFKKSVLLNVNLEFIE